MKKPSPFGKYLLLDRVNVGGMAEVFLAKSFGVEGFERLLAIKKILPTMVEDEEFITMFIDEARIAVQLNHANIVQIYELGKHDENYFIAMEYVAGRDLRTLLDRFKARGELMPQPQAVFVAQKMCEGLDYAHRKKDQRGQPLGIIHRDVSPQNVLVSFEGEVKLIDFGIAKAANRAQKTQAGILKGKFGYMSPEQVRGLPMDHRSDIFAVGVCLYEMLTGEKLFIGESDFSTLEKVRNAEVAPPTKFNADIPPGLEDVVLKSLARDVEDRYQWASDMQEDLMRFLLSDGSIFTAKQLSTFMRGAFADAIELEAARMEEYAGIEAPGDYATSGVSSSAPAVEPPPEQYYDEEPAPDDATQVFNVNDAFGPGGVPPDEKEAPGAWDADAATIGPGELNVADLLAAGAPVASLDDPPTDEGSEHGPADADAEDEGDPTVGARAPRVIGAGPLGDPGADAHSEAVGRFADEIPSAPTDMRQDAEPELLDQATRITSTEQVSRLRAPAQPVARRSPVVEVDSRPSQQRAPRTPTRSPPPVVVRSQQRSRGKLVAGVLVGLAGALTAAAGVMWYVSRPPAPGSIVIMSRPNSGVEILIDDRVVATESPHAELEVAPGVHVVTIRRPGTREQVSREVQVEPNEEAKVEVALGDPGEPSGPSAGEPAVAAGTDAAADGAAPSTDGADAPGDGAAVADGSAPDGEPSEKPTADPGELAGSDNPEPVPDPEPSLGTAVVRSRPAGATVRQAGRVLGRTPYTLSDLPLDEKQRLELSLDGYQDQTIEVAFGGSDRWDKTFSLDKKPAPQVVERAPPPPRRPRPRPRPRPQPVRAAEPQGTGKLVAMTSPVAMVLVDGRDTGRWTPVPPSNPIEVPAGARVIEFRSADGRSKKVRVTIEADKVEKLVGIKF